MKSQRLARPLALWTVLALLCPASVAAQPAGRSRAEAQARRAGERMQALQREADALARQARTLLVELRQLEIERQLKIEELGQIDAELGEAERQLADLTAEAADLEGRLREQEPLVAARLVELYKLGRPGYWRLLLGVEDLRAAGRAYRNVSALVELDRQRIGRYRTTLERLDTARTDLERRASEAQALREEARRTRAELDRAVTGRAELARAIDARRDLNAQLAGELQLAQQRLQAALAAMAAGWPADPVPLPLGPFRGDLPWPAAGRLKARFGQERHPQFGTVSVRNGIDIGAAEGTPVQAVHEGRVAFADTFTGYGNLVIVEHGGRSYSLYGHLQSMAVRRGDELDRGMQVGTVGRDPTGEAALYFELRIDGRPVDPVEWFEK